ncbi:alanine racemase [Luteococcus peritonei]|uniref:Alanine racemase n=1 Tax=Luteococcus peritonei TaxID=88874 RepID=A0ABW4S179_9ACTN
MLYATHAVVDLDAIAHNLAQARSRAGDRAVLLPVKADAYGHGAVAVAAMAQRSGAADWLGVATVPEALELRAAGITLPVLKLSHCFPEELDAALAADLVFAVVDEQTLRRAEEAGARTGRAARVHLKVDTGMRRIGAEPEQAPALALLAESLEHVELEGIFTHLPVSDMADDQEWTAAEIDLFRLVVAAVHSQIGRRLPWVHATPSGGTLWHDLADMTLVRPGIMAYGYFPDASTPRVVELRPAMEVRSRLSFVKRVGAGQTVGYGRTWTAEQDCWVATVPVGYADGYSRRNSGTGRMLVHGRSWPVVGRVCMDQTMILLGTLADFPEPPARAGDEVVVMGRQGDETVDADEIAATIGTISYEVTCAVARRVVRHHVGGGQD